MKTFLFLSFCTKFTARVSSNRYYLHCNVIQSRMCSVESTIIGWHSLLVISNKIAHVSTYNGFTRCVFLAINSNFLQLRAPSSKIAYFAVPVVVGPYTARCMFNKFAYTIFARLQTLGGRTETFALIPHR